jgi:HAMP domain-containing protein
VSRRGDLIAHPDISLVLQRPNLAHFDQVRAAFEPSARVTKLHAGGAGSVPGTPVFAAHTVIPRLDWAVVVEQPVAEIYGPLYASMLRTAALLLVGLVMALFAALFVARRVVRPLGALREGVERIGRGDLSHRLQVETADEIEVLAEEFNRMTAALQEAHAGLEQKVAERTHALLVVNERLDEASRHKSRFLASVSHELRTPLHAIIGFTRIVLRKTDGQIAALQRENLRKVLISAEHLLALINGLLDLSRIEAGKMEIVPGVFRLDEVLDVVASTVEPLLDGGQVQLVREIAPGLPPLDTDGEAAADPPQPPGQRREVHRGRDDHRVGGAPGRCPEARGRRHRHRHGPGSARLHLRGVPAGRVGGGAATRGDRAGAGDHTAARPPAGRHDRRRQRGRQGLDVHCARPLPVSARDGRRLSHGDDAGARLA